MREKLTQSMAQPGEGWNTTHVQETHFTLINDKTIIHCLLTTGLLNTYSALGAGLGPLEKTQLTARVHTGGLDIDLFTHSMPYLHATLT